MAARKLFDPASDQPFALSRSKVELFQNCPRCFYLDRRHCVYVRRVCATRFASAPGRAPAAPAL